MNSGATLLDRHLVHSYPAIYGMKIPVGTLTQVSCLWVQDSGVEKVTGPGRRFGLLLSVCYLWAVVSASVLTCRCQGHTKTKIAAELPAETAHCCQSETAPPSCCPLSGIESPDVSAGVAQPLGCCSSATVCYACTHCVASDLPILAFDNLRIDPTFKSIAVAFGRIDVSAGLDYSSSIDRPPDRLSVAPHIASTVLLC